MLPVVLIDDGALRIGDDAWFRGIEARATLRVDAGGILTIGDRALINSGASIQCSQRVEIGHDLRMAAFATITDSDMHEVRPGEGVRVRPVRLGNDVWIGHGAIVLPGVALGDGAVVGAGSVVTRDVDANTVVAGNPARVLRAFQPPGGRRR